jgi:16S rRNA (guanine527-N7)-methyltransferase
MTPSEQLQSSLAALGLELPEATRASLLRYLEILLRENEKINLTAIKTVEEGVAKHLVDSLSALSLEAMSAKPRNLMDLGSGGGMPGLALALALPELQVTLVESTKKKAHFLAMSAAELGLMKRVHVEAERAETLGQGKLRESFDLASCRAVGRLAVILELCVPLLKVGGLLIAYKGPKADEELAEAKKAMELLKVKLRERKTFSLPGSDEARNLLVFEKLAPTPKTYPRLPGTPAASPL